jgi:hypothetical protein
MAAKLPAGDARAGEIYFNGSAGCSKCHSTIDLAISVRKYGATTLRSRFLRPGPVVPVENVTPSAGEQAHLRLLENYSPADVANALAYLEHLR